MSDFRNGNFEKDWSEEKSHRCLVFPVGGSPFEQEVGNIFTPPDWTVWFRQQQGTWAQPECRDAWAKDPDRMHSGEKGFLVFTFYRKHDAGLMQQVNVERGTRLRFSAWAHAWSNHQDLAHPDRFPNPDNPRWSEGAGSDSFFALPEDVTVDALRNFTFWVGIDPTGDTNPFADTVVWGQGAHIYNVFHKVPAVEAEAQSDVVTVFLRSTTLWAFKHNDAYWDDAQLVVVPVDDDDGDREPDQDRLEGVVREPYHRVCSVIPEGATEEQAVRIFRDAWRRGKETVGSSYDDAMMGPGLFSRTANLYGIPPSDQDNFLAFRDEYYPGVQINFSPVPDTEEPGTAEEQKKPDVEPLATVGELVTLHIQSPEEGWLEYVARVRPRWIKLLENFDAAQDVKAASPDTRVLVRHFVQNQQPFIDNPNKSTAARRFLDLFWGSIEANAEWIDAVEGLNEAVATGDTEGIKKTVAFEVALSEEVAARDIGVRVCLLNPGVGNPDHGEETKLLLPAARAAVRNGHYLGYHPYWPATPNRDWLESAWPHYAGRSLVSWDPVFAEAGLKPRYLFTESGPIGASVTPEGKPVHLMATEGWRSGACLNGDWNRCMEQILTFRRLVAEWNDDNDDRAEAAMLFSSGGQGWGWDRFQYLKPEFEALVEVLK
jgi:hypothetical protein